MVYTYTKNSDGHFICDKCSKTYVNQNTMHYHLKTHEGKLPFECPTCDKQFLHASTLNLHKKVHNHEEQVRDYKCPSAGCEFKGAFTKANLLIHYVRKHCSKEIKALLDKTDTAYKCTSCTKEMKSLTAFHYHSIKCVTGLDQQHQDELKSIQ
jgi:hypothetical protein